VFGVIIQDAPCAAMLSAERAPAGSGCFLERARLLPWYNSRVVGNAGLCRWAVRPLDSSGPSIYAFEFVSDDYRSENTGNLDDTSGMSNS
jgi:hypothetical protein